MSIPVALRLAAVPVALVALASSACAPEDDSDDGADDSGTPTTDGANGAADCAVESLPLFEPGQLTIGTDDPAYPPWFVGDDPTNGKGYESAVAYAVADELGFTDRQVEWVTVPFNSSYQPGPKDFDFDINQISITPKRAEQVTFSRGYYSAAQAVITMKDSPYADATSFADLATPRSGRRWAPRRWRRSRTRSSPARTQRSSTTPMPRRRLSRTARSTLSSPTCPVPSTSPLRC